MARFEVTYDGHALKEIEDTWGFSKNVKRVPGWHWKVINEDTEVASGVVYGSHQRRRNKAIRLARRIARTHHYTEDVISTNDAKALKKRIATLERELLT